MDCFFSIFCSLLCKSQVSESPWTHWQRRRELFFSSKWSLLASALKNRTTRRWLWWITNGTQGSRRRRRSSSWGNALQLETSHPLSPPSLFIYNVMPCDLCYLCVSGYCTYLSCPPMSSKVLSSVLPIWKGMITVVFDRLRGFLFVVI